MPTTPPTPPQSSPSLPVSDGAPGLTVVGDSFLRDGRPHRIVSAAIHYFRIRPELWLDRLLRLRAMGVNTVETYIAWNVHEPEPGRFDFDGPQDVAAFITTAAGLGLDVIVRPGPFICAEWEFGGLPGWLLADPLLRLRRNEPRYLAAVDAWFDILLPVLTPLQAGRGGPVVAIQVENEYGSFANETAHLDYLRQGLLRRGVDCLLFTADGAADGFQLGGGLPGVLASATFGSRPEAALATLRRHQPEGPLFVSEYWHGWFDHWGEAHHVRDPEEAAQVLDALLAAGASVNIYMGHGGTNFGWHNGANHTGTAYQPTVTSYDYGAPVGEAGELTEKFHRFREVIARHQGPNPHPLPPPHPRLTPRRLRAEAAVPLRGSLDLLAKAHHLPQPEPMEALGQSLGLIHYRTRLRGPLRQAELSVDGLADRAQVFLDGVELGVLERDHPDQGLTLAVPAAGAELELLVENQGRINYGPLLTDRKGISGGVRLDNQYQFGWEIRPLPLSDLTPLDFSRDGPADADGASTSASTSASAAVSVGPTFHRFTVTLDRPADGFLALPGWTKGMLWLNGFALGRYWDRGPQQTLYAPAPLWRTGSNEIIVLELHRAGDELELTDTPRLGVADGTAVPQW
ncbi:glycoside hydrolase family 35 protein [Streptacidiphilus carbonis]|uniref:glycoside hydrolase family 35 protein n=1 Tax=Streptacidiphilus carbonis TaxID=105422 RepID=UPI0006944C01|nr:beta-galactosidase family protein [Streptacidiphilus carbonis]